VGRAGLRGADPSAVGAGGGRAAKTGTKSKLPSHSPAQLSCCNCDNGRRLWFTSASAPVGSVGRAGSAGFVEVSPGSCRGWGACATASSRAARLLVGSRMDGDFVTREAGRQETLLSLNIERSSPAAAALPSLAAAL